MKHESPKPKKRCECLIWEKELPRKRFVDEIILYVAGQPPKTLRGDRLPDSLVLNTGDSQEAWSVLEFFTEKVKPRRVVYTLPVEPNQGRLGRDAVIGVASVIGFQVLMAIANAVAIAMSN